MKSVAIVISLNQSCFGSHLAFGLFAIWIIHVYLLPRTVNKQRNESTKQVCRKCNRKQNKIYTATIFEVTFSEKNAKSVCPYTIYEYYICKLAVECPHCLLQKFRYKLFRWGLAQKEFRALLYAHCTSLEAVIMEEVVYLHLTILISLNNGLKQEYISYIC